VILIIDNYDSFVYNLARYVRELGYDCIVKRNDAISLDDIYQTIKPSHIILSPGPCAPDSAGICLQVVKALAGIVPILGVCLGHQAIAEALGAAIVKARNPMHGKSILLEHDNTGLFTNVPNPMRVGRYHSLIVDSTALPSNIHVNAWSPDNEIMAIQHVRLPLVGVQFHLESILTEHGHQCLKNFLHMLPNQSSRSLDHLLG